MLMSYILDVFELPFGTETLGPYLCQQWRWSIVCGTEVSGCGSKNGECASEHRLSLFALDQHMQRQARQAAERYHGGQLSPMANWSERGGLVRTVQGRLVLSDA